MQGVVFLGDRELEIQNIVDPSPGPEEVVLEIRASGMCGSDLKFYRPRGGAAVLGLVGDGDPVIAGPEPGGVVINTPDMHLGTLRTPLGAGPASNPAKVLDRWNLRHLCNVEHAMMDWVR